ncbi:DNA mismatch repair enzyme (predicted ATPase) [Slackia heliotrinireducens]|uniref:DNA mismatch repair enzyme (Predicted ATPase) n=1 Tax=Slackia heliotrinireducens (strain ATCC 29202 / DSM 20476 / NCTC 11029 / RHS 1) TaxID=471855 RepID=C7N5C5_SLAHD|nr:ATP-binding protein [Slackia heliotrinireducens]ACV22110.1 DNA mismatch repair enzyme (predicted ATPase) [Slackia heliotrinireducens DSM 20476]VEH00122.1 DNA mismatch repair enzyme (predicted ATPase) [Slackia heliotrinireducens]
MADQNLHEFIDSVSTQDRLRVENDLGGGFVRLRVSEAERRQAQQDIRSVEDAVIEMLRNARDAGARTVFVASAKSGAERTVVMVDDACGVPLNMWDTIFEPRVTSKLDSMLFDDWGVHGRGMALYSIKQNATLAQVESSVEGGGSAFRVVFDTSKLTERADQSTCPELQRSETGEWVLGASPHNINRSVAEFALANRKECTVYMGSMVEIVATLYAFGRQALRTYSIMPDDSADDVAPSKRLAMARNADELVDLAATLGISISSRSAYRVINRNVDPCDPFLTTLPRAVATPVTKKGRAKDVLKDFRGLKIAVEDIQDFSDDLKKPFARLAARYYLEPDVEPKIRVDSDGVHVTFPVRKM